MNAKQAIEIILENQSGARTRMLDYATSQPEYANIQLRDCEAFELAIKALREQEEREKGCAHCIGPKMNYAPKAEIVFDVDEIVARVIITAAARFCPMCGRRLEVKQDG